MPRCPICKSALDLMKYEGIPVYNCGECGGYWLNDSRLGAVLASREVQMPPAVQAKMIEIANASNSTGVLWCWSCGTEMRKEAFKNWPEIQIDHCRKCGGLWFDRGELEKCQIYWEYMQDHPDSEHAQTAGRIAVLDSRWAARKSRLQEKIEDVRQADREGRGGGDLLMKFLRLDENLDPGAGG